MSVNGTDDLDKKLKQLAEYDMMHAVSDAIQLVRSAAVNNCSVNTGELRQSIFADVEGNSEKAEGICWTNKAYAPYVEFGTGPVGQAAGLKIDGIDLAYRQTPWMIPVGKIDKSTAEKYRFIPIKEDGEVIGYLTRGQAPQPFLYPAMKNNEDHIVETLKTAVRMESKINR